LVETLLHEANLREGLQGIPRSTYCFRHTYATLRLEAGVDVRSTGIITTRKGGTALLNRLRAEELQERFPGVLEAVLAASATPRSR